MRMKKSLESEEVMTVDAAESAIRAMLQEMHVMGGNDTEPSQIQGILDQLKEGTLSPDGAVAEARAILNHKMEGAYH